MTQAPTRLTDGKKEFLVPMAALNGHAFEDDPVITYMLLEMTPEERKAILPIYWKTLVRSALLNNALITEANGWQAASVMIHPGGCVDNAWTLFYAGFLTMLWRIGFHGLKGLWSEFSGMTDNAKIKTLRDQRRYYYIFSQGTEQMPRWKGLAKTIMQSHQERAKAENAPIWLEATSISFRNLYISLRFIEVEERSPQMLANSLMARVCLVLRWFGGLHHLLRSRTRLSIHTLQRLYYQYQSSLHILESIMRN